MKRVTVVGGGIAGLTAAYRLSERGYEVKLYEQQPMFGGNMASRRGVDDAPHDIYPHMYLNWYHNFWKLLKDVGQADRKKAFAPMPKISRLGRGQYPRYTSLTDTFSWRHALQNLFSGVAPPADMFLFAYASIDLLAERFYATALLDELSVNGFLHARPYATERVAKVFNDWITLVWSIPSYLTSANDYQTFLKHGYDEPNPAYWLLRGAAEDLVIAPIAKALTTKKAEIHCSAEVVAVSCDGTQVREITLRENGKKRTERVDDLVLAVPPHVLSALVRAGPHGRCIVDAEPVIAEVGRLRTESIPMVHLYFTRKLRDIPREPVSLVGSKYALAFTDVSQTSESVRQFAGVTVLALSASERYGLPGTRPQDDAMAMIRELAVFIPDFEAGPAWGESADIDWKRTSIDMNEGTRLFINETGSDFGRPGASCTTLRNLHLAGDYCRSGVGMTCIEAGVVSGLNAVQSVVDRHGGPPVEIIRPRDYPPMLFAWLRLAWMPYAATAKIWSTGSDIMCAIARRMGIERSKLRHLFMPTRRRAQR